MGLMCKIFGHKWEHTGGTIHVDFHFNEKHWKCKRCEDKKDDLIFVDKSISNTVYMLDKCNK